MAASLLPCRPSAYAAGRRGRRARIPPEAEFFGISFHHGAFLPELPPEDLVLVYPVTRGAGPRLFPDGGAPGKLSLAACESFEHGVVYRAYRPQR